MWGGRGIYALLLGQLHQEVVGDDGLASASWPHQHDGDLMSHIGVQKVELSGCLHCVDNEVCHLVEREVRGTW